MVVNGALAKGEVDSFAVDLKKGQALVAALDANTRLGSPMDAVLQVVSPAGAVAAENHDHLGLDPRLAHVALAEGIHMVRVFAFPSMPDSSISFAGSASYVYRLTLTTGPFATHAAPVAVSLGKPGAARPEGWNIPKGTTGVVSFPGIEGLVEHLPAEVPALAPGARMGRVTAPGVSGAMEAVALPVPLVPQSPDGATNLSAPAAVSGHLAAPRAKNIYKLDMKKGQRLLVTLNARSLGFPTDPVVRWIDPAGKVVTEADDMGSYPDPTMSVTASVDGIHTLQVADRFGHGTERHRYLLTVRPVVPEFDLSVAVDNLVLPAGKAGELAVKVTRKGQGPVGPIAIRVEGLPAGVKVSDVVSEATGPTAAAVTLKFTGDGKADPKADPKVQIRPGAIVRAMKGPKGDWTLTQQPEVEGAFVAVEPGIKGQGAREIDAGGKFVLPGGIDSHAHIEQKSGFGIMCADDFYSGTVSAAFGGTTTVIPFAAQHRGMQLRKVVQEYHEAATPKAVIDYAFHLIVTDPTPQALGQDLPALIKDGYTSFKIYMTYDAMKVSDYQILDILALARKEGALVMVHCENHDMIQWLAHHLVEQGHGAPKFHAIAHARVAEAEATNRAISLARLVDAPMLIVHMSEIEAIETVRQAQKKGLKIFGETCPQYIALTADDMDKPGVEGAMWCCSPPPRDSAAQEAVWAALKDGTFQTFSSDHAPYQFNEKGKIPKGDKTTFKEMANGVPGLELRLPLLFSEGVQKGRISLQQRRVRKHAAQQLLVHHCARQQRAARRLRAQRRRSSGYDGFTCRDLLQQSNDGLVRRVVVDRHVLGPAAVLEPCVLRANARIVKPC